MSRLWPPAAAISSARLASSWPRTSARSGPSGRVVGGLRLRRLRRVGRPAAVEQVGEPRQRRYRAHLDPLDERRLGRVRLRDQQAAVARAPGAQRGVQRAPDRPQLSAQRELAGQRVAMEVLGRHLSARREQAHGDREVEARARLPHVRGREVDGQPLLREIQPGVQQRRSDALTRLADRAVRQSDERERREPLAHVDLDGDLLGADAFERKGGHCCEHPAIVRPRDARVGRGT